MTVQDVRSSGLFDLLLDKAGGYLPPDKVAAVEEAYRFAEEAHSGQYRKSGEPFIEHPLSTALYLVDLHFDYNALRAALLHDVVEDTPVTYQELADQFGEEVATLVDGVTKLTQNELMNTWGEDEVRPVQYTNEAARAASIRKMLMTMAEDVRVVIIKLADRLHNMRTLDSMPQNRKVAIAQETLDIYAPLAHRLGMWELKWLLEDLAFQHIDPEEYRTISKMLATKREEREQYIDRVVSMLERRAASRRNTVERVRAAQAHLQHPSQDGEVRLNQPDGQRHQRSVRAASHRRIGDRLLRGARYRPYDVEAAAGRVRRLHRQPKGQHVPVAPHRRDVRGRLPGRDPDPHGGDAPARRVRCRRPLALQGGQRRRPVVRREDDVAAPDP